MLPLSNLSNQPFIQSSLIPLEENNLYKPRYAHCYLGGTTPRLFPWRELGIQCINTQTLTFLSIFISISICTYRKSQVHTDTSQFQSNTTVLNSNFVLFSICNSLLWLWEIWLPLSLVYLLLYQFQCVLSISHLCHHPAPHMGTLLSLCRLWSPILSQCPDSERMASSDWSGSDTPYLASPYAPMDILLTLDAESLCWAIPLGDNLFHLLGSDTLPPAPLHLGSDSPWVSAYTQGLPLILVMFWLPHGLLPVRVPAPLCLDPDFPF